MQGFWRKPAALWKLGYQKLWLRCTISVLLVFLVLVFSTSGKYLAPPFLNTAVETTVTENDQVLMSNSFSSVLEAYRKWDAKVGCDRYVPKEIVNDSRNPSLQDPNAIPCNALKLRHVSILVKQWTWLPDNLDNLYSCGCAMSCLWTKSSVLADKPDAELYESQQPPFQRWKGQPLRVYMDMEAGRRSAASQDIFVSYHAGDTVQVTYAGAFFHNHRSYFVSTIKNKDVLIYWSSSRCLRDRMSVASKLLSLLPHHSFGKCLNNVGGQNAILSMYPECRDSYGENSYWANHLHCAMSHYKFVLAIENTITESYVTEKLFYALDVGAVPIYFGAPNVWDFVPPKSIIDSSKFTSLESLASYVKKVAADPVLYAGYHAWRRCGVMGYYHQTRAVSLDSLPCRLCATVSKLGGKDA